MTDKKIILVASFVAAILIVGLAVNQYYKIIPESIPVSKNDYPVDPVLIDMTLSLSSGDILGVKIYEEIPAIVIDMDPDTEGRLVIDDPMSNLKKAFPNSKFTEYVVLVDGEEVAVDEISFNIVAISVKKDSQRVEIIPAAWLTGN